MTRLITGLFLSGAMLAFILFTNKIAFFWLVEFGVVVCLIEYFAALKKGNEPGLGYGGILLGSAAPAVIYFGDQETIYAYILFLIIGVTSASVTGADPFRKSSNTLFGIFYISFTLVTLAFIRNADDGYLLVIMLMTATGLADTFAYYTGRAFGKTPLAPVISPNKTVEGFAGGVVGALAGALTIKALFIPSITFVDAGAAGVCAGLLGPVGDLTESAFKRKMSIKDSGSIIPGHGGMLDRLDSLLISSSAYYVYLTMAPKI